MHLCTRILSFLFIQAITVNAVGSTHNNSWNHIPNRTHPDTPDTKTDLDLDLNLGRDLTDLPHGNIPGNATGTGSDSTEEGVDDYEIEAGENKGGIEIHIFLCKSRINVNSRKATKTATIDEENDKDAGRIQVPAWLRAPIGDYKMDVISPNFALPLFNFRVKKGHPLETRGCGHPNGVKRYSALLSKTDRNPYFVSPLTGELFEYESNEEKSKYWTDYFTHKGYFKENITYYHPQHYCIRTITDTELELDMCPPQEGVDLIVKKCCPLGSVVRTNPSYQPFHGTGCVETVTEWEPVITNDDNKNMEIYPYYRRAISLSSCRFVFDGFIPNDKLPIHGISIADIQLQRTGVVLTRASGNRKWDRPKYDSFRYIESVCIDGVIADTSFYPEYAQYKIVSIGIRNATKNTNADLDIDYVEGGNSNSHHTYEEEGDWEDAPEYIFSHENQIVLFCPNATAIKEANHNIQHSVIYFILYGIASPFHLVTFLVYLLVARRQNVHGWTIAGFSFASLINNLSVIVSQAAIIFQHSEIILFRSTFCITLAIINQFGYIAQFSWLTVLTFDLWHTISSMVPIKGQSKGLRRFLCYLAFGFGVPLAVVVTSVVLETNYGLFDERVIRPQYGHVSCAIINAADFHLKYLPALILYIINVIFIGLTCLFLYRFKKTTARVMSNSKSPRSQARLFGKLFTVMGLSWAFDLIAGWVVTQEMWGYNVFFDIWNIIQSILLFWIFVCKKEIKDHLCMSYESFKYFWDLWERKHSKQKPAPSLFFFGSYLQGGETQNMLGPRMQYICLARLRPIK